jgi:hypothetical protein
MQTYKVIGNPAIFGVGMVLKLTKSQSDTRSFLLKQKNKNIYAVMEPVQFKLGEEITIVSGNVSKSLLTNLSEVKKVTDSKSDPKSDSDPNWKNDKPATNKNQKSAVNDGDGEKSPENQEDQENQNLPNV